MNSRILVSGFIELNNRPLFISAQNSNTSTKHAVVILPPFAEEMNKCRHLLSNSMRLLAAAGQSCFMLDNYGTGDSSGDLDTATILKWREDLQQLLGRLKADGYQDISFIAIRFGVLQLFDLLNNFALPLAPVQLVLWQPMFDSTKFWQQFARIKVAEAMSAGNKISQKDLEQQLNDGQTLEIAGYPISSEFYQSLKNINSTLPTLLSEFKISWFETSQLENVALPVQKMQQQLRQQTELNFVQLKAEPYWQTTELANADELITLTVQQLAGDKL